MLDYLLISGLIIKCTGFKPASQTDGVFREQYIYTADSALAIYNLSAIIWDSWLDL